MTSPAPIVLDPQLYQYPIDCPHCGGKATFKACVAYEFGRLGFCDGCGEEKIVPFTRVTQEAA